MKILPVILLGGAAVGAFFLSKAIKTQNASDKLILDFRDITSVNFKNWKITFNIRFDATNPTNTNLNVEQIILNLKLDGMNGTIARVRNMNTIAFAANERKLITIPAETNNLLLEGLTVVQTLLAIFSGSGTIKTGTLTGIIKANGFVSNYNENINF